MLSEIIHTVIVYNGRENYRIARFISFTHGYVEKKEMLIARKLYTMEEE
jgi:hypothetical protein